MGRRGRAAATWWRWPQPDAWFSYHFWDDDARAPDYARTVDIHRKPGYDPAELFLDPRCGDRRAGGLVPGKEAARAARVVGGGAARRLVGRAVRTAATTCRRTSGR